MGKTSSHTPTQQEEGKKKEKKTPPKMTATLSCIHRREKRGAAPFFREKEEKFMRGSIPILSPRQNLRLQEKRKREKGLVEIRRDSVRRLEKRTEGFRTRQEKKREKRRKAPKCLCAEERLLSDICPGSLDRGESEGAGFPPPLETGGGKKGKPKTERAFFTSSYPPIWCQWKGPSATVVGVCRGRKEEGGCGGLEDNVVDLFHLGLGRKKEGGRGFSNPVG